jgi:hypothetical protein
MSSVALVQRLRGRYREAIALGHRTWRLSDSVAGRPDPYSRLCVAIGELQGGDARMAAEMFGAMSARPFGPPELAARNSRQRVWMLAHVATALDRLGDTVRLARLIDTLQAIGGRSAYARDQRVHRYARGLLWRARGDTARAVAEWMRARLSPVETYFALPLTRGLLTLGRPREAAAVAEAALRGPLDSQNQYESRTAIIEALADALAAAGRRTDAARWYQFVAEAWRGADTPWAARGARADRLAHEDDGSRRRRPATDASTRSPQPP